MGQVVGERSRRWAAEEPSARLAKLLRPFDVKPRQLWIDGDNERGYDVADFEKDSVAPYLEKDARTLEDARTGSRSQAGSSDSYRPSEVSGAAGDTWSPLPGDDDFLEYLLAAGNRGLITESEFDERAFVHELILRGRRAAAA